MTQSAQFRKTSQPLASTPEGSDPYNRPSMTSIIQRELEDFNRQRPRRGRVVGRLIFLQVALLLMDAPLVAWPTVQPAALGVTLVGLVIFAVAWLRNLVGDAPLAQRLLVGGSAIVTAANMIGQLFWHPGQVLPVGLASFPFLLTIFIAGLLFEPEVVVLVSVGTTASTAIVFFLALFLTKAAEISDPAVYLLAVSSLGLQALAGMMAWQIGQFIKEYSAELNQARREEFIATQYDALRRSVDEQANRLRDQVGMIASNVVALSTRNYAARIGIVEGDLKPIADAFNLLAQQLGSFAETEHAQVNVVDDLTRLMDIAGQMAEGSAAGMPPLANMPMTASAMGNLLRSVTVTLQRAQQSMQTRFDRLRDLAVDSGNRLTQTAEATYATEATLAQTLATIGHLRSAADRVFGSAEQMSHIIDACLVHLSDLLPPEVSAHTRAEAAPKPPTPAAPEWQQVLPGVTVQLDIIDDDTELGPDDVAPSGTVPIPGVDLAPDAPAGFDPNAQARLREVWSLITQLTEKAAEQIRDAQVLEDQLGIASRTMRQVDNEVIAMRQMILQTRQVAEQAFMTSAPTRASGALSQSGPLASPGISAADLLNPPDASGGTSASE
jgi:hypothetical protein